MYGPGLYVLNKAKMAPSAAIVVYVTFQPHCFALSISSIVTL